MAAIPMEIAAPIGAALLGGIGWIAKLYLDERRQRGEAERACAVEIARLNVCIAAEKDKLIEAHDVGAEQMSELRKRLEVMLDGRTK